MGKYKLTWRDLTWRDFKIYLFALFKAFIPKKKIKSLDDLEEFIQSKSAWVTQVTLYGYLKTRMGTRYVLHFENDEFIVKSLLTLSLCISNQGCQKLKNFLIDF